MRALLLLIFLLFGHSTGAAELQVFATIEPIKTLIKQIAAKRAIVHSLVPSGFDPHLYEPSPRQISQLATTQLYVSIGMPFERVWQSRLQQNSPGMRFLDANRALSDSHQLAMAEEKHQHEDAHEPADHGHLHVEGIDPHIWTDPILFAQLVPVIVDSLVDIDRAGAALYRARAVEVIAELEALDASIREIFRDAERRSFIVVHPAWGHFAKRYGLEQVALEKEGKRNSAKHQAELLSLALDQQINTVFAQSESEARIAEPLAKALRGQVVIINPLSGDYADNLLAVARAIRASLQP